MPVQPTNCESLYGLVTAIHRQWNEYNPAMENIHLTAPAGKFRAEFRLHTAPTSLVEADRSKNRLQLPPTTPHTLDGCQY
jgi:hypothetical protein